MMQRPADLEERRGGCPHSSFEPRIARLQRERAAQRRRGKVRPDPGPCLVVLGGRQGWVTVGTYREAGSAGQARRLPNGPRIVSRIACSFSPYASAKPLEDHRHASHAGFSPSSSLLLVSRRLACLGRDHRTRRRVHVRDGRAFRGSAPPGVGRELLRYHHHRRRRRRRVRSRVPGDRVPAHAARAGDGPAHVRVHRVSGVPGRLDPAGRPRGRAGRVAVRNDERGRRRLELRHRRTRSARPASS